jgi:hypothetical protein
MFGLAFLIFDEIGAAERRSDNNPKYNERE